MYEQKQLFRTNAKVMLKLLLGFIVVVMYEL